MPLTIGTAGHIDHGKTWLVRALTGKDTDRLPEEQRRGISIDLGYAPLELPDGRPASLVDVPGHERFVRTMVAGATGIDLFLLVIDAQEGVRPQTLEHLAVLRLLGVELGVVAVTKADAVDAETLELAIAEAQELVPGAPVVAVSAKTGSGIDELRAVLAAMPVVERNADAATRLYVDRAFSLPGIGTIATGTLWSGSIAAGDALHVAPGGRAVRVRSVQVHDAPVERADAGQRVAVNLASVERRDVARGDALVAAGSYPTSFRLDVALTELEPIPASVTVHLGTTAVAARMVRSGDLAQLRLERRVVAARGDRVVLRTDTTVGGGVVLDPAPPRGLDIERLELLRRGDPQEIIRSLVHAPITRDALVRRGLVTPAELDAALAVLPSVEGYVYSAEWLTDLRADVRARLERQTAESPLEPGLPLAELIPNAPWAQGVAELLDIERRGAKAYLPGAAAALGVRTEAADALEAQLAADEIVRVDDRQLSAFLEEQGRLRRVGDGFAVSTELYERGLSLLQTLDPITIASFRDALGVGRRTAQLVLERYDADGLTLRRGDVRVVRRQRS